ncbi:MAG: type II secretion system protein [Pseudomonadales bacterium]
MNRQQGFTIIELVVVIILLGIMAATALPRFMDVTDEAHDSVVSGVLGGMQSGITLYRAQWVAEGQPGADSVITEFNSLRVNASGYPYGLADNSGSGSNVANDADCSAVFSNILQAGAPSITAVADVDAVATTGTDFATHTSGTNCVYYYLAEGNAVGDTVDTLTYNSTTGAITQATLVLP